jgi:NhaP-type Na+/H+ or K+/H+ antiporter
MIMFSPILLPDYSIFLELGLSVFGIIGHWNWSFIGWSLLSLLIARALNVYPIVLFFNKFLLRDNGEPLLDHETRVGGHMHGGHLRDGMEDGLRSPNFVWTQSDITELTATPLHRKDLKIRPNVAGFMWFSGLRGAVSVSSCVFLLSLFILLVSGPDFFF